MLAVEARRFDGFLRRHAELQDVQQHLQQRLVLIVAARAWTAPGTACRPSAPSWGSASRAAACPAPADWDGRASSTNVCMRSLMRDAGIARDHRRQPGAAGRGREHVALAVHHVHAGGVVRRDGGVAGRPASAADRRKRRDGSPSTRGSDRSACGARPRTPSKAASAPESWRTSDRRSSGRDRRTPA